eukprot:Colp12_sorted_trinity150504_noHs@17774
MPELAGVERARRYVERHCAGKRIKQVNTVEDDIVYSGTTHTDFAKRVKGSTLVSAHRHGKQMWFALNKDLFPMFHFGMTGSFHYREKVEKDAKDWPPRFTKCELVFQDDSRLAFVNIRRLGRIRLYSLQEKTEFLSQLGFDPLLNLPELKEFGEMVKKRAVPVKALLLDQAFSAGVGNWIADVCSWCY